MVDLRTAIRDYFDEIDPPFEVEELMRPAPAPLGGTPRARRGRPLAVALAAALATIVAVGGILLILRGSGPDVADQPTTAPLEGGGPSLGLPVTAGDTGDRPSIAFGPDGLPVIAFHDNTAGTIGIAGCFDAACTAARVVTVAETGREVSVPLLAVGPAGETWVAFSRSLETAPWNETSLVHCAAPDCTDPTTTSLGAFTVQSLAVSGAGNPVLVLSSWPEEQATLTVQTCADPVCGGGGSAEIAGPAHAAVWIGPDDLPRLAYLDGGALVVEACTVADCTATARREVLSGVVGDPYAVWAAVDDDGSPVMLAAIHESGAPAAGSLVRCLDPDCGATGVVPLDGVGPGSSIAVGGDGVPVAAVLGDRGITVVACTDPGCSGEAVTTPMGIDGWWTSIGIPPDGIPVFAATSNSDLAVVRCGDAGCSAGLPEADSPPAGAYRQVLLAAGTVTGTEYPPGLFVAADGRVAATFTTAGGPVLVTCETPACEAPLTTSLGEGGIQSGAFTADGTPVLAVTGGAWGGPLELVRCDGPACPAPQRVTLAGDVALWAPPAIALDPSGAPAIAFQGLEDFHVSLVRCDGPACGNPAITRLEFLADADGTRWLAGSIGIVIGADDRPLLLISSGSGELRLVRCADRACSAADVAVVDDGILGETDTASITPAPDGAPVMAWYANGTARFARCADGACTTWEVADLGPSIAEFIGAQIPSIAFAGDPIVAYRLAGDAGVALAVCEDPGCADARIVPFGPAGSFRLATDDGLPVLAWYARSGEAGVGVEETAERVEGLLAGAETAVGGGTFGDEERSALAGELRSLADGAGSPAAGLLFEAADAVEGGADPSGELSGVLETLFGALEARDLWLSRCADPACLGS